jgi:hypothetical protein
VQLREGLIKAIDYFEELLSVEKGAALSLGRAKRRR